MNILSQTYMVSIILAHRVTFMWEARMILNGTRRVIFDTRHVDKVATS